MFTKFLIFALLGATLVSAAPESNDRQYDTDVLRSDWREIAEKFLNQIKDAAKNLAGKAKAKFEELKKFYVQLKEEAQAELKPLEEDLKKQLEEAKKYGLEKYTEVKQKVGEIYKEKQAEIQAKINNMQQKIKKFLEEFGKQ